MSYTDADKADDAWTEYGASGDPGPEFFCDAMPPVKAALTDNELWWQQYELRYYENLKKLGYVL